ncbi:hypothetical protein CPLU01_14100 [Colletotrichum plurivorum]|uniref:Uncharacterized protein n=1 Tax=Colletotrichum plurivorum TaxID=2175906 RepID=A0A8H6JLU0_9PEZI|nr:hypothetical protein CPLU01_14100 [Colletotrichum plurivorum]
MPVTLQLVNHLATPWNGSKVTTPEKLLEEACPNEFRRSRRIIQSSLSSLGETHTSPSENGFVWAAYQAYSHHHHLTIRPDDIWFAILTQLSFYINANAEKLRDLFVGHERKKELEVIDRRSTTAMDRLVGSILLTGAVQKYFSFHMGLACGIPSVTLLGEVADYEDMLTRIAKIEKLGEEPEQFAAMLRPVLRYIILSFTEPASRQAVGFWNRIVTRQATGSGFDYISGWIGAFCYWTTKGSARDRSRQHLVLDGVEYVSVETSNFPTGIASVPVKVDDNGNVHEGTMLAGSFGIQGFSGPEAEGYFDGSSKVDSHVEPAALVHIRPLSGWVVYENKEDATGGSSMLGCETIEDLESIYQELIARGWREDTESLDEPLQADNDAIEPAKEQYTLGRS